VQLLTCAAGGRSAPCVWVVVAVATLCLTDLASVQGQEMPPPTTIDRKAPERPKTPGRGTPAAPPRAAVDETTFLFTSEIGCSITVDGEEIGSIPAQGLKKAPVSIGQHVVVARSDDGKRQWEQIVEAKGKGQIIVRIDFASAGLVTNDEFDRRAAGVRKAMADLEAAAEAARETLGRSFGFHNQDVSTTIFSAQQSLKAEMQAFRAVQTTDASRRRVAEDLTRAATIAEQYVDVVTKAIASAQSANSWAGEPNRIYSQAAATLTGTKWSPGTWQLLRASPAFCHALPLEEQARLGLVQHAAAFDLGAEALSAEPQRIVSVTKKGLADQLGLRNGDRLVTLKSLWDLKVELAQNPGKRIDVEIERKGQREIQAARVPTSFPDYPPASTD
jgi:hypothetical protein